MQVILFDFDGVIVDTFSFCFRIAHSRNPLTEDDYRARFTGNINNALEKAASKNAPSEPFDFFGQYTPELMACRPNEKVAKVIKELARDHVLIIISSTITPPIDAFLEAHGLRESFKEILGNDIEKSKVKKIKDVLIRYKIKPTETVFITDTLGDINEANECGVRCIAVSWGYQSVDTLKKGSPYKIIDRPEDIIEAIRSI